MFEKLNDNISCFFSKHPIISIGRIFYLFVAMLIYINQNNTFTIFLLTLAFVIFFLESLLKILDVIFKLFTDGFHWVKNNKEDIYGLLPFFLYESFSFIMIIFISFYSGAKIIESLNPDFQILNSNSATTSTIIYIILLISLCFVFIMTLVLQMIYFKLFNNRLGYTILNCFFVFLLSILFTFILGMNSIIYEYIEINKDFFIQNFIGYGFNPNEIAITVKSLYSLFIYGLFSLLLTIHTSTKIAFTVINHSSNTAKDESNL